jgi:hypothetical protein
MPIPKQQLDADQIRIEDPNEPDVIAFSAGDPDLEIQDCNPGFHWDADRKMCVQDS